MGRGWWVEARNNELKVEVVGGVWVWVNVVGKKKSSEKIKIKKQKVVKFMKRKSLRTYQSYSPSPRSAVSTEQVSESPNTKGH